MAGKRLQACAGERPRRSGRGARTKRAVHAHAIVLQRAAASCERLDCALDEAQDGGRLKFFNQV